MAAGLSQLMPVMEGHKRKGSVAEKAETLEGLRESHPLHAGRCGSCSRLHLACWHVACCCKRELWSVSEMQSHQVTRTCRPITTVWATCAAIIMACVLALFQSGGSDWDRKIHGAMTFATVLLRCAHNVQLCVIEGAYNEGKVNGHERAQSTTAPCQLSAQIAAPHLAAL